MKANLAGILMLTVYSAILVSISTYVTAEDALRTKTLEVEGMSLYNPFDLYPVSKNRALVFTRNFHIPYKGEHVGALLIAGNGTVLEQKSISSMRDGYAVLLPEDTTVAGSAGSAEEGIVFYLESSLVGDMTHRELTMRTINTKDLSLGDPVTIGTFGTFGDLPAVTIRTTRQGNTVFCVISCVSGRHYPGYHHDSWFIILDTDGNILSPMYHHAKGSQVAYSYSQPVWTGTHWLVPYIKQRLWYAFNTKKDEFLSAGLISVKGLTPDLETTVQEKKLISVNNVPELYRVESFNFVPSATDESSTSATPGRPEFTVMLDIITAHQTEEASPVYYRKTNLARVTPRGSQIGDFMPIDFLNDDGSLIDTPAGGSPYRTSPPLRGASGRLLFVRSEEVTSFTGKNSLQYGIFELDLEKKTATCMVAGKTKDVSLNAAPTLERYGNYYWSVVRIGSQGSTPLFFRYEDRADTIQ